MSTHLYLAPAAAGKTHWVIDVLRSNATGLRATPIAVVATPLQALSMRQRLARAGGALGVHILTFDELYVLLLHHCGDVYTELAEPVRFRLLHSVIVAANAAGQLPFYGGLATSGGFVHIVQELIELFKGATVSPEALAAAIQASLPAGSDDAVRLGELALMYAAYHRMLQDHGWSDRAGMGWLALEATQSCNQPLPRTAQLLVFDGFASFTQIQLQVIASLAAKLPEVVVTLTGDVDAANAEAEVQPGQRLYIRTAAQLCAALGVRAEPLPVTLPLTAPQVEMIEATNQAAEARAALRWLKQRIVQDGCRPQEVALLARSLQPYRETVVQVAAEFGMPVRILDGLPLAQNPAIAALLDLLRLAMPAGDGSGLNLPRRGVIEAWRSPYFDWDGSGSDWPGNATDLPTAVPQQRLSSPHAHVRRSGDAGLLMTVALEGRVASGESQWRKALEQFARRSAMTEVDAADNPATLVAPRVAALAAKFDRFVRAITPPADASTFGAFIRWLEQLIGDDTTYDEQPAGVSNAEMDGQLGGNITCRLPRVLACVHIGAPETAGRDLAALRAFKDVLRGLIWAELAAAELRDAPPALSYPQFLDELLSAANLATFLPPVQADGAVLVATAAQVRGIPLAAVAVIGLAEGEFPARISEDPFFRDADRVQLQAQGLPLELSTVSHERELFADCLARPRSRLLLTRPRLAEGGAEWEPSPFWREQREHWKIAPQRLQSGDLAQPPASPPELVERLARQPHPTAAGLAWLQRAFPGRWQRVQDGANVTCQRGQRRQRQASPFDGDLDALSSTLADRYGAGHVWSPSRLESYLTCGFMFLAGSVLHFEARPEPDEGLDAAHLGDIYHRIFEQVYTVVPDPGDLAALLAAAPGVTEAVLRAAPQELGFRATAWWAQECAAIGERVLQTLANLHATGDRYHPIAFEQRFGGATNPLGILVGGELLYVRGVIDRIDRHIDTQKLRVIDYKTGSSGFDAAGLQTGKKLQLPLYALAAQEALGLGEVEEGFYWLVNRGEPSALQLSRWEGGPAAAIATAVAHMHTAVQGVRAGQFAPHPPADGCPAYCAAAAFCANYRER